MNKKDLCGAWRRCCDSMCQKWLVQFCAGHFSLDEAPQSADQLKLIAIKLRH